MPGQFGAIVCDIINRLYTPHSNIFKSEMKKDLRFKMKEKRRFLDEVFEKDLFFTDR